MKSRNATFQKRGLMKNKQRKSIIALSILSAVLVSACSLSAVPKEKPDSSMVDFSGMEGIKILKATTNSDGTIVVKYSLEPNEIESVDFVTGLRWQEEASNNYETSTWHEGKNPEEYMSYTIDQNNKQVTFRCLNPFGRQMVFSMQSPFDSSIRAELKIDYTRKRLTAPSYTTTVDAFQDQEAIVFNKILPTYSIGSKGDRPDASLFSLSSKYYEVGSNTYDSLFGQVITEGLYTQTWKYKGVRYTDKSLLRTEMKNTVLAYLNSLFSLTNPVTFKVAEFRELFTYEYSAYYTYQENFLSSSLYKTFLTRYKSAYENHAGMQATIKYGNDVISYKIFDFNVDTSFLTSIGFDDALISF